MHKYSRIQSALREAGLPDYRYSQLLNGIFKNRIGDFRAVPSLPSSVVSVLEREFGPSILTLKVLDLSESSQATKVLFGGAGGQRMEAVHLRYRAGWNSYCISSQVGCGFGCRFCATGKLGLLRNMSADEITDQILFFHLGGESIDSISFMGMGEALANPSTFEALEVLTAPRLFNLGARRITVSTIGLVKGIERLTRDHPQVNLTVSLHSPFDEQRSELMPINISHPLSEVMEYVDNHVGQTGRKVYLAYVMLEGVNDSREHAESVSELIQSRAHHPGLYHVNLIQYNPAHNVGVAFKSTSRAGIRDFARILERRGIHVTIRQSFGEEIDAACGQLYSKYDGKQSRVSQAQAGT